ncbi:MAG: calcium-binding protein, partial [Sphingobium sp.]
NLTAHKSYVFTSDSGFANIVVRDAAGNALHDVANGELTVSPAQSGIYYLDVSGDAGDYSVRMFELVGDVAQDMTSRGVIGNVVVGSNTASDTFVSTANHDSFVGLGGDDRFIAGAGYDIYSGGAGFDTVGFTRFKTGAVVDLQRGGTVESGNLKISLASIEHVEGSRFADQIYGSGAAERLVGGRGDDQLFGIDGDDRLFGGLGNDRVEGGAGRDYLDGGDGIDSLSYEHAAAGVVVSLAITGAQNTRGAGVDSVAGFENIRGSAFDDRLTGDDGANVISGLDGADVMIGLGGNDAYYVDNAGDRVVEKAGGGYDTVFAAVDYQLVGDVEALTLTGRSHNDATGNALDNVLTGNSGHNRLNGGAGADRMIGKGGNDIYYVSNAGDVVVEQAGEGHDLVVSTVSFDLRGTHVEDLRMIGSAHINASGDADVNEIRGNAGNNILGGDGGDDLLTGGAGADIFVFDTALGPDIDRITDFSDEGDKIALNPLIFAGIGPAGTLAAGAFQRGRVATEADDRILYDSFYQQVFYDADGNGPGRAVLFAQINHGANLTHSDFMVIG